MRVVPEDTMVCLVPEKIMVRMVQRISWLRMIPENTMARYDMMVRRVLEDMIV